MGGSIALGLLVLTIAAAAILAPGDEEHKPQASPPPVRVAAAAPDMPVRGMDMLNVAHIFGTPLTRMPPVGDPPITRWVYPGYIVYFERNLVLKSVVRRDAPDLRPPESTHKSVEIPAAMGTLPPAPVSAASSAEPAPIPSTDQAVTGPVELLLDVFLNEQELHQTALFLEPKPGELYAQLFDLQSWRLVLPPVGLLHYDNVDFYPLNAIPGITYKIDTATQTVHISVPPAALSASVIDGFYPASRKPQVSPLGGFMNYSLYGTDTSGSPSSISAYTELGMFGRWGVGTTSYLGIDINGPLKQWVRLESTFTQDHPDDIATFKAGDAITSGGMTGLAVRFGGVQYGTNFATQPGLATLPLPSIGGSAAVPSTVQLYVNGVLQRTQDVQPGPFIVPTVPVSSGPGTITLVVRDLLGREQVVTAPFYAANTLLAKGLDDYSFSFGEERQNFGVVSNDYGPALASAVFRRGYTDYFTGEFRGEAAPGQQTLGAGGFISIFNAGVLNLATAVSHSAQGQGMLGQVGYQYLGTTFNGGVNLQLASPHFTQAGYLPGQQAPRTQASGSFGAFLGEAGSVSIAYIHQDDPILGKIRLATLNYTKALGAVGFMAISLYRDLTGQNGSGALLSLTIPLGEQRSAYLGVSHQNGATTPFAQLQQSLPAGTGFGYRVGAQFGKDASSQGELDYQNNVGIYDVAAYRSSGQTLYQAGVNGGFGYLGGDFFASRPLNDSFAVVEVPGQPDVDIYAQNQVVARTNSSGYAVIPRLNAYQDNNIGYDPRNLPLDTDITTSTMDVVPYYRSGVLAHFDVKSVRGVTFTVHLPGGKPLPAGAEIEVPGQPSPFPVGYDGEAYVTGLTGKSRLKASWADQTCEFTVDVPPADKDPLPDLGVFTCEASKP
jgi:outer membrane usher protein